LPFQRVSINTESLRAKCDHRFLLRGTAAARRQEDALAA
jgi:hypothetical protein